MVKYWRWGKVGGEEKKNESRIELFNDRKQIGQFVWKLQGKNYKPRIL